MASPRAEAADAEKQDEEVGAILRRMEEEVLAFRVEIERAHGARCDAATLAGCARGNFDDCSSVYPGQRCMEADELVISACGDGTSCNALRSKSETTVRIHASLAQEPWGDPGRYPAEIVESVCYSRLVEPYMVERYNRGDRNQMYFGSSTGAFRIIPGRHDRVCGAYDPRRRPWFVAASSGPKDVVLVIDTSRSMGNFERMNLAKEAAKVIVDTLTVLDHVAIVAFSDLASQIGGHTSLIRATKENKDLLAEAIDGLEADGGTNFYDAFDVTFNALENTIRKDSGNHCNIAVLFLTDGQITIGPGKNEVIDLVNKRTEQIAISFDLKTTVFAFSLGRHADHEVTKSIACSTSGIWTQVDDFSDKQLIDAMSSYYKLYALGLGEGGNKDFTAWVEPYLFYTAGQMGTSVSTPVYDRSVDPPLFLGVVTVDMYMHDLEQILGEDASSSAMLQRFILLSAARCPKIELTELELDALRFLGGGEEAMCGASNATDTTRFTGIIPEKCSESDWPADLWRNTDMEGRTFEERACCEIGGDVPSDMCPSPLLPPAVGNRLTSQPSDFPSGYPTLSSSSTAGPTLHPSSRPSFLSQQSSLGVNPAQDSITPTGGPDPSQPPEPKNAGLTIIAAVIAALFVVALAAAVLFWKKWNGSRNEILNTLRRMESQNSETLGNNGERYDDGEQESHHGRTHSVRRFSAELPPLNISDEELEARFASLRP